MSNDRRILVVGAGALGCEVLSKLAAHGCQDLEVVDMDVIEVSNLSRQLLFRREDVGKAKAAVAARQIVQHFPHVRCRPRMQRVETLPPKYFGQFGLIFCQVDSVETRLWLNAVVCAGAVHRAVLVEGGVEGMMGHVRLTIPRVTPCLYCTRYLHVEERDELPLCTLAGVPRTREHCVGWALSLAWPKECASAFDPDNPDHVSRLTLLAQARAEESGIAGVDGDFVESSVRRIIPAVVSTCALVAGIAVLVGLRWASGPRALADIDGDNYWFFNGKEGAVLQSHCLQRDLACPVCGGHPQDEDEARHP